MIMFVCFADFGFRIIQKSIGVSTVNKQSMMPTNQINTARRLRPIIKQMNHQSRRSAPFVASKLYTVAGNKCYLSSF
jgi:hypothetical protein